MTSTIDPVQADLCPVCLHDQNREMSEGNCAQCDGEFEGVRFHLKVEFSVGPAQLPGNLTVDFCVDCASWIRGHINTRGVRPAEAAHEEYLRLIGADKIEA